MSAGNSHEFMNMIRQNAIPFSKEYEDRAWSGLARFAAARSRGSRDEVHEAICEGVLTPAAREFPEPDRKGAGRLRELDECLVVIRDKFPVVATEVRMCSLACRLLEGVWRERARGVAANPVNNECECAFCIWAPRPPVRRPDDYDWRRSDGRPLAVKIWPHRWEIDSVLTGGWAWTRKTNDSDIDLGLRFRYEDDILVFHEYTRVVTRIDVEEIRRAVDERLAVDFSVNGARALVCGLFAAYKRSVGQYWLGMHVEGAVTLSQTTSLDKPTYALLQLLDCLFWHVPPDSEVWREENLAALVLCRVLDDMIDTRADAVTGEPSSLWLSSMSSHDKVMYAICAIALVKYGCMPESHGLMWNTWLMANTMVWLGLTGRHGLWFEGATSEPMVTADDCPLCDIYPNHCAGLVFTGITLTIEPQPSVETLGQRASLLSKLCRTESPHVWPLFHRELARFEALHGKWSGDVGTSWEILRRTYVAAVEAAREGGAAARDIQIDSGIVGSQQFHRLCHPMTGKEDIALLAYMFGGAHPHFLWNCTGYRPTAVWGDWLDG